MATQKRSQITQVQLLTAAANEIQRVGYRDATLATISQAAGVTTGSVYFHFGSKEEVARALIARQHQVVRDAAEHILSSVDEPSLGLMMRLCADLAWRLVEDPVVRAGIRLTTDQSTFEAPVPEPYQDWIATFTALGERALQAGEITDAVSPDVLANFIIPAFTGVQLVSETFTQRQDLLSRVHEMWHILILAIVPSEAQHRVLQLAAEVFREDGRSELLPVPEDTPRLHA